MNTRKYLYGAGVFALGMLLLLNYIRFISYYKGSSDTGENFIYIYTDSQLPPGIVEECHKSQIGCEVWKIGNVEELCAVSSQPAYSVFGTENMIGEISIAMVRGTGVFSYREMEHLFLDRDFIIDVNLLKWIMYIIIFGGFFCIMVLCLCHNKKWGNKKWLYFVILLIWSLYIKIFISASIEDFPVWSLPGKWSDIEGWRKLGGEVLKQISCIIHFKDYPIICRYYEGVIKSIFYLFLSLILMHLFFKSLLRLRHFGQYT